MNLQDLDPATLQASPKLNALIHLLWMNKRVFTREEMEREAREVWKRHPSCTSFWMGFNAWTSYGEFICEQPIPDYSTNPDHAGEARREASCSGVIHDNIPVDRCTAFVRVRGKDYSATVECSETDNDAGRAEALAICRAIVAAMQAEAKGENDGTLAKETRSY